MYWIGTGHHGAEKSIWQQNEDPKSPARSLSRAGRQEESTLARHNEGKGIYSHFLLRVHNFTNIMHKIHGLIYCILNGLIKYKRDHVICLP